MQLHIQLHYPAVWGQTLHLTGSLSALGNWNPADGPALHSAGDGCWTCLLDLSDADDTPVEYKFCLLSPPTPWNPRSTVRWEPGPNRRIDAGSRPEPVVLTLSYIEFEEDEPRWRCAGLTIPVFSLRSEKSFGIGDFGDLLRIMDWMALTGQKILQLLPINDTTQTHTWQDSYPYNAISIYALHPLYLDLNAMGRLHDPRRRAFYRKQQRLLNALPAVDYEAVDRLKRAFFEEIFQQDGDETLRSPACLAFLEENEEWLTLYADFCCRRDPSTSPALHRYLQYHAHRQMTAARRHAHRQGIILKGDIPIGISRNSVEAATEPRYFNLNQQAGAPPDAFSADGQNWGFPTYRWPAMEADDYQWWKKRFRKMADYFDAYRIDHILGFFRIWQIPVGATDGLSGHFYPALPLSIADIEHAGLAFDRVRDLLIEDDERAQHYHPRIVVESTETFQRLSADEQQAFRHLQNDYFYHRNNEFWKQQALRHLTPLIHSTDMLACGEDLGMIPPTVPEVMQRLQILSLEIERMPKSWDTEFTDLQHLPYRSVCTPSTHDMPPLRSWWKEDPLRTQRYYNHVLKHLGPAPTDCTPDLCRQILVNHLHAPSMLVIIPLQDWLSLDEHLRAPDPDAERINVPAHSRHYWRYRMHLSIETLLSATEWNNSIRAMIRNADRA